MKSLCCFLFPSQTFLFLLRVHFVRFLWWQGQWSHYVKEFFIQDGRGGQKTKKKYYQGKNMQSSAAVETKEEEGRGYKLGYRWVYIWKWGLRWWWKKVGRNKVGANNKILCNEWERAAETGAVDEWARVRKSVESMHEMYNLLLHVSLKVGDSQSSSSSSSFLFFLERTNFSPSRALKWASIEREKTTTETEAAADGRGTWWQWRICKENGSIVHTNRPNQPAKKRLVWISSSFSFLFTP